MSLNGLPFMFPGCQYDGYTTHLYTTVTTVVNIRGNIS